MGVLAVRPGLPQRGLRVDLIPRLEDPLFDRALVGRGLVRQLPAHSLVDLLGIRVGVRHVLISPLTRRGLGALAVLDQPVQQVTRAARRIKVPVAVDCPSVPLAHQPSAELAHRLNLLGGWVLVRAAHQRHAVPSGVATRLSGLHPVEPAPLEDVTVRAGAEAVPDVSPAACRPHVELPGALPVLHARAMRLARQPLVGPVVVDDEPVARVRGGGAGWPPTELGPRDDPHQSLTLPTLVMLPSTFSHTWTILPVREAWTG